ncbi:SAF domain-containing protein [Bifidobacterium magnum]|uniref:SAF-like protein (Flagellar basal-body protein or pilus-assembly protein) n=1 Tax=Bifidobacterium magnum TaxID=1692 RepID=A0A087BB94_9BIFI|nr:SAF domain-containing protein [Bifidobacterium magnum]KFI68294.1 SAF-like protein (flagellar basal-body protein or pilus-assembly protein) [Bifidobacterium magnum]
MVTFFHSERERNTGATSRNGRKRMLLRQSLVAQRRLRRIVASICAIGALLAALITVESSTRMMPALVTTNAVHQGETIDAADVAQTRIPYHMALEDAVTASDAVMGMVATVSIPAHSVVTFSMVQNAPLPQSDATIVDVKLASATDSFPVGSRVALVTGTGCETQQAQESQQTQGKQAAQSAKTQASGQNSAFAGSCTLTTQALVMGKAHVDDMGSPLTPMALPASDALAVIGASGPIIAVQQ